MRFNAHTCFALASVAVVTSAFKTNIPTRQPFLPNGVTSHQSTGAFQKRSTASALDSATLTEPEVSADLETETSAVVDCVELKQRALLQRRLQVDAEQRAAKAAVAAARDETEEQHRAEQTNAAELKQRALLEKRLALEASSRAKAAEKEADERAAMESAEKARLAAEAMALAEATRLAEEKAAAEAKRLAEEKAAVEAKRLAEEKAAAEAAAKAKREAEERAAAEAAAKAKREAEERAAAEAAAQAKREAEERAAAEAAAKAKREAEERAAAEAAAKAKREAEERAAAAERLAMMKERESKQRGILVDRLEREERIRAAIREKEAIIAAKKAEIAHARRPNKSEEEEKVLQDKYAAASDLGDRAFTILKDLGMI